MRQCLGIFCYCHDLSEGRVPLAPSGERPGMTLHIRQGAKRPPPRRAILSQTSIAPRLRNLLSCSLGHLGSEMLRAVFALPVHFGEMFSLSFFVWKTKMMLSALFACLTHGEQPINLVIGITIPVTRTVTQKLLERSTFRIPKNYLNFFFRIFFPEIQIIAVTCLRSYGPLPF